MKSTVGNDPVWRSFASVRSRRGRIPLSVVIGIPCVALLIGLMLWRFSAPMTASQRAKLQSDADLALKARNYVAVARIVKQLERDPSATSQTALLRAELARGEQRWDDALEALKSIPADDPARLSALWLGAQVLMKQHRLRDAQTQLETVIDRDPDHSGARRALIYLHGVRGEKSRVDAQFRYLAKSGRLLGNELLDWCLAGHVLGDPREIEKELANAVSADPDDRAARRAWVDTLIRNRKWPEVETALAGLPRDDPFWPVLKAQSDLEQGRIEAARVGLQALAPPSKMTDKANVSPDEVENLAGAASLRLLGKLALIARESAQAEAYFRAANDREPNHPETWFGLGAALSQQGRTDAAAPFLALSKAHQERITLIQRGLSPPVQDVYGLFLALGQVSERLGRPDQAQACYQASISIDPLRTEAQAALQTLESKPSAMP